MNSCSRPYLKKGVIGAGSLWKTSERRTCDCVEIRSLSSHPASMHFGVSTLPQLQHRISPQRTHSIESLLGSARCSINPEDNDQKKTLASSLEHIPSAGITSNTSRRALYDSSNRYPLPMDRVPVQIAKKTGREISHQWATFTSTLPQLLCSRQTSMKGLFYQAGIHGKSPPHRFGFGGFL